MIPRSLNHRAITLLELVIAVALLSMLIAGFLSVDLFSRNSVLTADRQAKVQNSIAFSLAHMTKNIGNAIGDRNHPAVTFPASTFAESDPAIFIRVDSDSNGLRSLPGDKEIAYSFNASTHSLRYYSNYTDSNTTYELISDKIVSNLNNTYVSASNFTTCSDNCTNYIGIKLIGRWDPDNSTSQQNPEVTFYSYTKMPLVSTN